VDKDQPRPACGERATAVLIAALHPSRLSRLDRNR
jgi:hypothetical protein